MTNGQLFTLWSIRMSTAIYVASLSLLLCPCKNRWRKAYRITWTAACIFYLAHVSGAFQFFHGWSHLAAYRETARQTRELFGLEWGGGLYFNYLFSLVWLADVLWAWASFDAYQSRPRWIGAAIHSFLAFMFFNATIVFGSGFRRWFGICAAMGLAILVWRRMRIAESS
jgi:hypothetical protein